MEGRQDEYSRLCGRDGEVGLASELEGDLLDGGGLGELKDHVPAEESGVDVDACAAETKDVVGDMDLEKRVFAGLVLGVHVLPVARRVGGRVEVVGRRKYRIWVEWPQCSMEGGGEGVLLWGRRRSVRTGEYIRHGERSRTNKKKGGRKKGERGRVVKLVVW